MNALRTGDPLTTKYEDFLENENALSGPLSLTPGIGATYSERLNDNGIDNVRYTKRVLKIIIHGKYLLVRLVICFVCGRISVVTLTTLMLLWQEVE